MCVIVEILPGMTIPWLLLDTAVNNNEDGYGLVIKHKDSLDIIKECPEGGSKTEDIHKLLEKNKEYLRYLHLRHRTAGTIDLDNSHPFNCYNQDGIQIELMHNGTMMEYKPDPELRDAMGKVTREADNRSDTKIFVENILQPLFKEFKSPDYTKPVISKLIMKFWPYSNRGLLISNKFSTLLLDSASWKLIKTTDPEGKPIEFRASNDSYFDKLVRGKLFDRLEAERKQRESEERAAAEAASKGKPFRVFNPEDLKSGIWPLTKLKDVDLKQNNSLVDDLMDVLSDFDIHTDAGLAELANLTQEEISGLCYADPAEAAGLLVLFTSVYRDTFKELLRTQEKHREASKMISGLKGKKVG